tara:strand:- start:671 stop:1396 length:726 start_codon:yes stop_codon:yes gene_type:complete
MTYLFSFILNLVDFFYKKKVINYFKKNTDSNIEVLLDIGSHKGETVEIFMKNFNVNNIYSFEASPLNYTKLKKNIQLIQKKNTKCNIKIYNLGVGSSNDEKTFYDLADSNSSTFNKINKNSLYFKKKSNILSFFFNKNFFIKENIVKQICLFDFIKKNKLEKIDILKIDTEGYEFEILKGLGHKIMNIKLIYFEHHYDNMIKKNYKFSDIHDLLTKNGFVRTFKIKMPFRKTFDYVYKQII